MLQEKNYTIKILSTLGFWQTVFGFIKKNYGAQHKVLRQLLYFFPQIDITILNLSWKPISLYLKLEILDIELTEIYFYNANNFATFPNNRK